MVCLQAFKGLSKFTIKSNYISYIKYESMNIFYPFCRDIIFNDRTNELTFYCTTKKHVDNVYKLLKKIHQI